MIIYCGLGRVRPRSVVLLLALVLVNSCTATSAFAQNPVIEGNIAYFVEGTSPNPSDFVPTESFGANNPAGGKDIVLGKRPGGAFANAAGDTDITDPYGVYLTHTVFPNLDDDGYTGVEVFNNASLHLYQATSGVLILTTHDASSALVSVAADSQTNLIARDHSTQTFLGPADLTYAYCLNESTFNYLAFAPNASQLHYAYVSDNATFNILYTSTSGYFENLSQQIASIDTFGNSTVNAEVGLIRQAFLRDNVVLNLNGGQLGLVYASGNSTINLRYQTGGDIFLSGNSKIDIYGKNLRLAMPGDGRYGIGGELLDAPFAPFGSLNIYTDPSLVGDPTLGLANWGNIRFINTAGNVTAPEPGALALLAMVGTAFPLYRRSRRINGRTFALCLLVIGTVIAVVLR